MDDHCNPVSKSVKVTNCSCIMVIREVGTLLPAILAETTCHDIQLVQHVKV